MGLGSTISPKFVLSCKFDILYIRLVLFFLFGLRKKKVWFLSFDVINFNKKKFFN